MRPGVGSRRACPPRRHSDRLPVSSPVTMSTASSARRLFRVSRIGRLKMTTCPLVAKKTRRRRDANIRFVGVTVREYRDGDAIGIARIGLENGAYYARLAPDYFKQPNEEGLADFLAGDGEWRDAPTNLALVAEVDGDVAGYLEASIQPPLDSAQWQSQRDLSDPRLFINYVGTGDTYKRTGVASQLVEAAEEWGRANGATVAICDTYIESPLSMPFWEERMGYQRQAVIFRKSLR